MLKSNDQYKKALANSKERTDAILNVNLGMLLVYRSIGNQIKSGFKIEEISESIKDHIEELTKN